MISFHRGALQVGAVAAWGLAACANAASAPDHVADTAAVSHVDRETLRAPSVEDASSTDATGPAQTRVRVVKTGPLHPTGRVALATLRTRSRPDADWKTAEAAFRELLTLRDSPDPAAASVLGQILDDNTQSNRILKYAAAQALSALGTGDALRMLDAHALRPDFDGRLAFDYAFDWDMDPDDRDAFVERCALRNCDDAPTLELRTRVDDDGDRRRLLFDLTVRNDLDHAISILDPASRNGELLVFRAVGGHVARTIWPGTCEHMGAGNVRLAPRESRTVSIAVETVAPSQTCWAGEGGGLPERATVAARAGNYQYLLGAPGAYDVVARWTSNEGRSVSAPVRVAIAPLR